MLQPRKVPMEFELFHVTVSWGVWFTGLILEQCRYRSPLLCDGDTAQFPSLLLVPKKQGMIFWGVSFVSILTSFTMILW